MSGKGSKPRPLSVDAETFASNWDLIFKNKLCEHLDCEDDMCDFITPCTLCGADKITESECEGCTG